MKSRHSCRGLLVAGVCMTLCSPAPAQSGGIEIFSGETIFSEGNRLSIAHLYERQSDLYRGSQKVDDPADRRAEKQRVVLGYNYGLTARMTVGALLPFVDPERSSDGTAGRVTEGDAGLGDSTLFGKWRMYTLDRPRNSRNLSFVLGLETPTGKTGSSGPQPGSGSWDPFAALAMTESRDRWRFDGLALYKWNTEGSRDLERGDEFSLSASVAYRYLHRPYPGASNSAKLGLLWQREGSASRAGLSLADSGSRRLSLRPALGFHPNPAIDISLAIDLPLTQHYRGEQLGDDFRTFIAFGYRF